MVYLCRVKGCKNEGYSGSPFAFHKLIMLIWTALLCLSLALSYIYWRISNRKLLAFSRELPGPPTLPLVGNALMFWRGEFISLVPEVQAQYGDLIRFWLGPELNIVACDPEDLRTLLTSQKTSVKGKQYKYMREVLGEGLLSGSGSIWRRHRKIVTPNYGKRAVESFTELFNAEGDLLQKKLESQSKKEVDIYKYVVQTTTYCVCQCLMGLSREQTLSLPKLQTLIDTGPGILDVIFNRMTHWWQQIYPVFWFSDSYQTQKQFLATMHECCGAIVKHREEALQNNNNMKIDKASLFNSEDSKNRAQISVIDRLLLSEELNFTEMVQETFTQFTAGQEATAKVTSFLLLLMAYHPECQERLYEEMVDVGVEEGDVTEEHLRQMPYLEMVFKEIIRMYPIGAAMQRSVIEDIAISKTTIPAGCSLVIPVYHIQRDPRFWKNPDAFDPDRFTPENSKGRPAYAFIPFSSGPMDCIGRHFGAKLAKTIAIKVFQKFQLTSNETYEDMKLKIAISVECVTGYKVILNPRNTTVCNN